MAWLATRLQHACSVCSVSTELSLYVSATSERHVSRLTISIKQNRTLICLFSHSLLLDALISTCARILLLELFFSTARSQDTCADIIEAIWTDQQQLSRDAMSSLEWQHALLKAGVWCKLALGAVHAASIGVLICTCAAQGTVAVAVRKYGMQVGRSQEVEIVADEKDGREEARNVKIEITQET
jgi:hypothetical protein